MDENDFCYMTEQSSCRKQSYTFTSNSVLCLGMIHEHLESKRHWIVDFDGEPVESEWDYFFPGHTTLELLQVIQRKTAENRTRLCKIQTSNHLSCRCTMDID